jgi:nitrate/nitrite transport system permease protein
MTNTMAIPRWYSWQKILPVVVPPLIVLLVVLALWQILCSGPNPRLPAPTTIIRESWHIIVDPFFDKGGTNKGLALQVIQSLRRVAVGYALASCVGVSVGIVVGTNRFINRGFDPFFQVLRTVPPLAWLPFALAGFQQAETAAIFVIFITAVWPILINTSVGVQQVPQDYRNVARILRLNRWEYFWTILLPSAAPYIFTGMRIAAGLSWLAIVAAEMLTGGVGIGFFIWDAWNSSRITDIFIALLYVGMVGLLLDRLVFYTSKLIVQSEE